MRYEPARYLGIGLRRQDCFGAFAGVSTPYTADVKSGAYGRSFERTVSFLTGKSFYSNSPAVCFLVVRYSGHHGTFFGRNLFYIVVEMGYDNATIGVDNAGQHAAQDVDRVGNGTAEVSRMEVARGPVTSISQ